MITLTNIKTDMKLKTAAFISNKKKKNQKTKKVCKRSIKKTKSSLKTNKIEN